MARDVNSTRKIERMLRSLLKRNIDRSQKTDEKNDLLTILRNLIFFVAIYLYFIGWTYCSYLYSHFGISLYSLDVPFYYFFIYSYYVIFSNSWWIVPAVGGFLAIMLLLENRKRLKQAITIVFLLIFFPLSFRLARKTAFEAALLLRKGYGQTIELVFKESQKKPQQDPLKEFSETEAQSESIKLLNRIMKANERGDLRLLTQTKDKLFVIYQPPAAREGGELPMCYTYVIAVSDVALTTIEVQNTPDVELKYQNIPR